MEGWCAVWWQRPDSAHNTGHTLLLIGARIPLLAAWLLVPINRSRHRIRTFATADSCHGSDGCGPRDGFSPHRGDICFSHHLDAVLPPISDGSASEEVAYFPCLSCPTLATAVSGTCTSTENCLVFAFARMACTHFTRSRETSRMPFAAESQQGPWWPFRDAACQQVAARKAHLLRCPACSPDLHP